MGIRTKTILKLENRELCKAVLRDLEKKYNKELIKRRYNISRRQLERIIEQQTAQRSALNKVK